MKYWIETLENGRNEVFAPCGSDTYYMLDGRNKLSVMVQDGYNRCNLMKNIHKDIVGFRIMKGTSFLKNETCIKQILF